MVVWAMAVILLVPVSSFLLQWYFDMGGELVIGNEELFRWVLTPAGFGYLIFASGLTLTTTVIHYAGLFYLITDDLNGRQPSVGQTLLKILPRIPLLFKLCLITGILVACLLVLFAAGWGGVYLLFLSEFDLMYYYTIRPAVWYYALFAGGLWTVLWGSVTLYTGLRCLMGLPAFLSGYRPFWLALHRSWSISRNRTGRLFRLIGISAGFWFLMRFIGTFLVLYTGSILIGWVPVFSSSIRLLIFVTTLFLAGTFLLDVFTTFLGFSFLSTVVTKFYYEESGLELEIPKTAGIRKIPGALLRILLPWLRPARAIPLMLLLMFGSILFSGFLLERVPDLQPVAIAAHRAGPPSSPENTLSALERSIDAGADVTEIDVQLTRDGVAVLVHDEDYMRVADLPGRVSETDYSGLQGIVQQPDDGTADSLRYIVTLEEFLTVAEGRIETMVELKYYGWNPELAEEVVRIVREQGAEERVLLMSLNQQAVRQLRELAPEMPVGYVTSVTAGDPSRLDVQFLAVARQAVSQELIRLAHQQGIEIYVWTVNRADRIAEMMEMGVDGIITDDPEMAVRVREELGRLNPAERVLLRVPGILFEEQDF